MSWVPLRIAYFLYDLQILAVVMSMESVRLALSIEPVQAGVMNSILIDTPCIRKSSSERALAQ